MARITAGNIEFDLNSAPASTTPAAAYDAWAAELGLPSSGTLLGLDADDTAFAVPLAQLTLGVYPIACFASEGGLGLYEAAPTNMTSTGVTYPGVGRMYGLATPAALFFTFHPNIDCRSELVKLQRSTEEAILSGRIRHYNSETFVLNFAMRLAPGRVQLLLNAVDQPVPFKVFGAPGSAESANIDLLAGTTTQIDVSDLPFVVIGDTPVYLGRSMVIGQGPVMTYGTPSISQSVHQSVVSGAIKDLVTGVLGKGVGRVYGTVQRKTDPANTPLKRKVRLVRERDGLVVREVWSDAVTGGYDFRYIDELQTWTVIAYDHEHNFRAVIADGITPEIIL